MARRVLCAGVACSLLLLLIPVPAGADQAEDGLRAEAYRLTGELIDLRARKEAAGAQREALLAQLQEVEKRIATAEAEAETLKEELVELRAAYRESLRNLYMNGEASELEVLLESKGLDELWRDNIYLNRITGYYRITLERLQEALDESKLRERDLREYRSKKERLLESLDEKAIDRKIASLETRLNEINASLREMSRGGGRPPAGRPVSGTPGPVPRPGALRERVPDMPSPDDFQRTGVLFSGYTTSYGVGFHGRPTSSGVIYNMYDYTCAHRTLPFGTWLLVTYRGKQVIVQVNDRGPFVPGRVLDLSHRAAETLGLYGVQWTEFEVIVPKGG